jgi:hypothetical protein
MNPKDSINFAMGCVVMPCFIVLSQALMPTTLERLQGEWKGLGPAGPISLTVTGDSLYFFARTDFWYEATFTLPIGADPQELHATITDSSPPTDGIGDEVFAIVTLEGGGLILAVNDGSDAPPISFLTALSVYDLQKVQSQKRN